MKQQGGSVETGEIAGFFQNASGMHLFSVLHAAQAPSSPDLGVVFCHSISEERYLGYRALTEFARYLASRGICSIRFDCAGFGDSEGDMIAVTVSSQVSDVRDAVSRLVYEFNVRKVVLVGLRFGATVARLAASRDERIAGCILIAPVLIGADFWVGLLRTQQMSCLARGIRMPLGELRQAAMDVPVEIKAERYGRQFVKEMEGVNLLTDSDRLKGRHLIVSFRSDNQSSDLAEALVEVSRQAGSDVDVWQDEGPVFWSEKALYDGYLPIALYQHAAQWLKDHFQ